MYVQQYMKHALNSKVKVVKAIDDTFDQSYLGMEGVVIDYNTNCMTGNTKADPLYTVRFNLNTVPKTHSKYVADAFMIENFWHEELEIIKS